MHALSTQIVCLLIAQIGPAGGYPPNQPQSAQSAFQTGSPAGAASPAARQPEARVESANQSPLNPATETATVPVHSRSSLARAESLVGQFIAWDPDSLEGEPVTLLECVQRAAGTGQQSATINAYWQLCTAIGRYTQTEQELVVLAGISPQFEFEQTQIRAAQRSVEARRAEARVHLLAAQEKLADIAQLPIETLPLPSDRPFVGKYHTRLTTMYAGRAIPRKLRTVDRALPHQLKLIEQRAEAVDANARLLSDLAGLYQQGQVPLSVLLGTCHELTNQQDAFLQAVASYNYQIATYSQTVVGSRLPAESLVSTLIRQPATENPRIFRDNQVLPAAARQPEQGRGSGEPSAVRPAFERNEARSRFEPAGPPVDSRPPFDPNGAFQLDDSP